MTNIKIVGVPTIVNDCFRIALDSKLRNLYGLGCSSVLMRMKPEALHLCAANQNSCSSVPNKKLRVGRFNLPSHWCRFNDVQVGNYVYLLATDDGLCICPSVLEVSA